MAPEKERVHLFVLFCFVLTNCCVEADNSSEVGHASNKILHLEPWDTVQPRHASFPHFAGVFALPLPSSLKE